MSEISSKEYSITILDACKQSEKTTSQRQVFDHYSACQGRSLDKPNLIAIE